MDQVWFHMINGKEYQTTDKN